VILKPLASSHHAELQRIIERATQRFADLAALDAALAANPTEADLADIAFAWSHLVMGLGGWGWWSVSKDGALNPALVSWNKAWWVVPIDVVLERRKTLTEAYQTLRAIPSGTAGALEPAL
jgi:hypothetical protein